MGAIVIPAGPLVGALVVLIRIGFLVGVMPIFGDVGMPRRVRVMLIVALTALLAPIHAAQFGAALPRTIPALIAGLLPEALIGLTFGLIGWMMFAAIQIAGQIAGHEMGFGIASEVDPTTGIRITVTGQLQFLMGVLLFFYSRFYMIFFEAIAASFREIPPFAAHASGSLFDLLMQSASRMFVLGLKINFPVVSVSICVNVAFALIAKAVQGFNVMMESFPTRILAGLATLGFSVPAVAFLIQKGWGEMSWEIWRSLSLLKP